MEHIWNRGERSTVDYNTTNAKEQICSYYKQQSPREFRVLLLFILPFTSALAGTLQLSLFRTDADLEENVIWHYVFEISYTKTPSDWV